MAISAAGTFRSDDGGETWLPVNHGLVSDGIPDTDAEVGHCVHHVEAHPTRPDTLFMQKHWDVMRSDDAGANWTEISGNLPTDFGFPIVIHPHEGQTAYVVPITSDSLHYPPDGKLRVWRPRPAATSGSSCRPGCRRRTASSTCTGTRCPWTRWTTRGSTSAPPGGQVYCSADCRGLLGADRA